jgi:glycosyltransferase involved in cell wall biosynthesis
MAADRPRILGVSPGDPFDRVTWSGLSHYLFEALDRRHSLAAAVSGEAPQGFDLAAKVLSVHPRRERWIERYEFSPVKRWSMSTAALREARRADGNANCVLQIGAWYDLGPLRPDPAVRCSYHDGNLAQFLRYQDVVADPSAAHIQRTMRAERRIYDRLDLIMPMSEWLRQSFIEDFGQQPEKVVTVGAGANLDSLPDSVPQRPPSPPRFLVVASELQRKGGPELLAALELVRDSHPEAELSIVGQQAPADPPAGTRWLGRIRRSDPDGTERVARIYAEATAYVMPSRYEPFGIAFLEAMAYGLPCIGARVCAMPEIIDEGVTGLLVEPRDVDGLAAAMTRLVDDPEAARAMGEAGFRRLHDRFTWDHVAGRMVDAIEARLAR